MKDDNQVWDCLKMSQPSLLAKTMFDRAKKMGISQETLERVIRDPIKTEEFILKLSELSPFSI